MEKPRLEEHASAVGGDEELSRVDSLTINGVKQPVESQDGVDPSEEFEAFKEAERDYRLYNTPRTPQAYVEQLGDVDMAAIAEYFFGHVDEASLGLASLHKMRVVFADISSNISLQRFMDKQRVDKFQQLLQGRYTSKVNGPGSRQTGVGAGFFSEMRPSWTHQAACHGLGTEFFYASHKTPGRKREADVVREREEAIEAVLSVCGRCAVATECLRTALQTGPKKDLGVWGGMFEEERLNLRRTIASVKNTSNLRSHRALKNLPGRLGPRADILLDYLEKYEPELYARHFQEAPESPDIDKSEQA